MLFVALVSMGVLLVVLFSSFVAFDKLVRSEHTLHHQSWIADGKPAGFFWRPKESDPFTSQFARLRLSFSWLFFTPEWISDSQELRAMLRRLRYAVLVWNVGALSWFIFFKTFIQQ